jgi:transcriptional regulator with XRE-family HTH domain
MGGGRQGRAQARVSGQVRPLIAERIAYARRLRRISQLRLAELLDDGTNVRKLSRWETGVATPHAEALARLATTLDVSADFLLGLVKHPIAVHGRARVRARRDWQLPLFGSE